MMRVCFDDVTLNRKEERGSNYEITVFGEYWEDIPADLANLSNETISNLDFDGGYTAYYRTDEREIVFQGYIDLFSMYYICADNTLYFSDDWYSLLKYTDERGCRWDLNAVADYFESTWNNIVKYDRSPIREIRRLDRGTYIEIYKDIDHYEIRRWDDSYNNDGNGEYKYTKSNLDEFKKDFFDTLDYYLEKIASRYTEVSLATSGGLDCNTITAEFCRKYPSVKKKVFTSRVNGDKDESDLAQGMREVISEPIETISIQLNSESMLTRLEDYIKMNLPPRYFNELSEDEMCCLLMNRGHRVVISGMGAENIFGFFDNEYYYLVKEYFDNLDFSKAYDVFTAAKVSYNGLCVDDINHHFIRFVISYFEKKANQAEKDKHQVSKHENPYLLHELPEGRSESIRSWNEAIDYATYSGEIKAMWYDYQRNGIKVLFPFAGRRFVELGKKCDPHIFADKSNKSCVRYAVRGLLPDSIVDYKKKMGNPGQDYREVVYKTENINSIKQFVEQHTSTIVNNRYLLKQIEDGQFGHYEFIALSLMVFESIIKTQFGRDVDV